MQTKRGGKRSTSWKPGQSGNPGGRPKDVESVRRLAAEWTEKAITTLADLMQTSDQDRVRVAAAEALLDRAWGKPAQPLANPDGTPLAGGVLVVPVTPNAEAWGAFAAAQQAELQKQASAAAEKALTSGA